LLRFNLQPCSLAKPFDEQVVGFYVHTNMNFIVTERKDIDEENELPRNGGLNFDAAALPGAPVE
jgi:hypothetical protein